MRKRTAAFIGSAEWRKRDVRMIQVEGSIRLVDKPSRISITYHIPVDPSRHEADLAHRVIQLTT